MTAKRYFRRPLKMGGLPSDHSKVSVFNDLVNDLLELISCIGKVDHSHGASGSTCSISSTSMLVAKQANNRQLKKSPEGGSLTI
jgi:hypothetical protein